jgi:hypothetical protein
VHVVQFVNVKSHVAQIGVQAVHVIISVTVLIVSKFPAGQSQIMVPLP